jgi:hypothetical protein
MIGLFHPQWRTVVVVQHIAELRAEAARYQRAQQPQSGALPVMVERSPEAGPEPDQPSRAGA